MKLQINDNSEHFDLKFDKLNQIVVEEKTLFFRICNYISNNFETSDYFTFVNDESTKFYNIEDVCFPIPYIFNFDLNSKKIINVLYKNLKKILTQENKDKLNDINSQIFTLLRDIIIESGFDLTFDDIDFDNLIKATNVRFENENDDSLIEKLLRYIETINKILGFNYFFTINLEQFMSKDDIKRLIYELSLKETCIINIKNIHDQTDSKYSNIYFIDESLCTFNNN